MARLILGHLFAVHGLIHLLGFASGVGLLDMAGTRRSGSTRADPNPGRPVPAREPAATDPPPPVRTVTGQNRVRSPS